MTSWKGWGPKYPPFLGLKLLKFRIHWQAPSRDIRHVTKFQDIFDFLFCSCFFSAWFATRLCEIFTSFGSILIPISTTSSSRGSRCLSNRSRFSFLRKTNSIVQFVTKDWAESVDRNDTFCPDISMANKLNLKPKYHLYLILLLTYMILYPNILDLYPFYLNPLSFDFRLGERPRKRFESDVKSNRVQRTKAIRGMLTLILVNSKLLKSIKDSQIFIDFEFKVNISLIISAARAATSPETTKEFEPTFLQSISILNSRMNLKVSWKTFQLIWSTLADFGAFSAIVTLPFTPEFLISFAGICKAKLKVTIIYVMLC